MRLPNINRLGAALLAVTITPMLLGGISGCQLQQQGIIQHEDSLSDAGFMVRLANTAERQAMLQRLPANRFLRRDSGGASFYVYADPVACSCLYVGNQNAYDQYVFNQQLDFYGQEKMAAQLYDDDAWNWEAWGPWEAIGPVYGPGLGW